MAEPTPNDRLAASLARLDLSGWQAAPPRRPARRRVASDPHPRRTPDPTDGEIAANVARIRELRDGNREPIAAEEDPVVVEQARCRDLAAAQHAEARVSRIPGWRRRYPCAD